ncbi:Pseudouridine-5'-phosphate glycosidase [Folsomia candida]|uniref:Pseudouridine-5'-phosphate glycosidase n=1 Tax=Folsomia candida TaxID=158441 RepID=A0A226E5N9_FOLCA|nr:Pseudouridine-5'-phosphate glycosidase [Folsomia candida]
MPRHYCPRLTRVNMISFASIPLHPVWVSLPRILLPTTPTTTTLIKSMSRNNAIGGKSRGCRQNSKFSTSANGLSLGLSDDGGGRNVDFFGTRRNFCSASNGFRVSEEVRVGVEQGKPVVALESAIITHGMPHPHNVESALHFQNIVRELGAIPATVGVIQGQLTVGLSDDEIVSLGSTREKNDRAVIKISRRDLPIALSQRLNGGTTVSGTIIGAVKAGIHIFATGGIGGVHRGAETTFDISADLRELGRNQIAVVSAGVKSILDIGKTLEYLETEGVCVVVLKKKEEKGERYNESDVCPEMEIEGDVPKSGQIGRVKFPSFFTAESQFAAPYSLSDELQAAHLVNSSINFKLNSGILIAIPIPKEGEALVGGKETTPFLLAEVNRVTQGSSLAANKCLVENNVRFATQIAILLAKLRRGTNMMSHDGESGGSKGRKQCVKVDSNRCKARLANQSMENTTSIFSDNEKIVDNPQGNISPQRDKRFIVSEKTLGKLDSGGAGKVNAEVGESGNGWLAVRHKRPVVVGGSSMDLIMSVKEPNILVRQHFSI